MEKIPCPSNGVARLNDGVFIRGQFGLNAICGVNTRDAGTDDKNVEVGPRGHGTSSQGFYGECGLI